MDNGGRGQRKAGLAQRALGKARLAVMKMATYTNVMYIDSGSHSSRLLGLLHHVVFVSRLGVS